MKHAALLAPFLLLTIAPRSVASPPAGWICEDTPDATPWYEIRGAQPGPTVLITGGVHGNEPAGALAAEQIRHWKLARGRLIVVPRINQLGLKADTRWYPPERNNRPLRDPNRNYPTAEQQQPRTALAEGVWQFILTVQPDLVVDLHEGFDFHATNSKSVGSSVICKPGGGRSTSGERMLAAVNSTIEEQGRKFELLDRSGPAIGSLARACAEELNVDAFILETTFKDQPLSLRTRQHRVMVSTLLTERGLLAGDQSHVLAARDSADHTTVAIFDGPGTGSAGVTSLKAIFEADTKTQFAFVGPTDIQPDILSQFDVTIFPGGSGSKQGKALGENRREHVRQYLDSGHGVIGICAGGYLVSSHYSWSLNVLNTSVYNKMENVGDGQRKSMWYRGTAADVKMQFSDAGERMFGHNGIRVVRYHNGPIISPGPRDDLPDYEVLATFRSEVSRYEPQKGTMVDTPAIVTAPFGKGRVLSISPHPEFTPDLRHMIHDAVRWVAPKHPDLKNRPPQPASARP